MTLPLYPSNDFTSIKRGGELPTWVPKPQVGVLMPVYNQSKYLETSIRSVLEQSHSLIHLTVVNDGSTENVEGILKHLQSDPRLHYVSQSNLGLPKTLNRLSEICYAQKPPLEFTTWHSADNEYSSRAISEMLNFLIANPDLGYTFADVKLVDDRGEPFFDSGYRASDQKVENNSLLSLNYPTSLLTSYNDNFINACFLYRTEFDKLLPPYTHESKGFEDYQHWLQFQTIVSGEHLGSNIALYRYRLHRESLTSSISSDKLSALQKESVERASIVSQVLQGLIPIKIKTSSRNLFPTLLPKGTFRSDKIHHLENYSCDLKSNNINSTSTSGSFGSKFFKTQNETLKYSENTSIEIKILPSSSTLEKEYHLRRKALTSFTDSLDIQLECDLRSIHRSHLSHLESPPLHIIRTLKNSSDTRPFIRFLPLSFSPPLHLVRARMRSLGGFGGIDYSNGTVCIFTPDTSKRLHIKSLKEFIRKNQALGIMLIAQSEEEREVADEVYLSTSCASNLRIIDTKMDTSSNQTVNSNLLHALGSVDAILSLHSFSEPLAHLQSNLGDASFLSHPITDSIDFCMEAIYAAASGRVLLAPTTTQFDIPFASRTLPHVYPWYSDQDLPQLKELKNKIHTTHLDAVIRSFNPNQRLKQILSSALVWWI